MSKDLNAQVDQWLAHWAPGVDAIQSLPLTPFELFMWLDDRPEYPLTFVIDFRFDGPFDRETFEAAWRFAVGRNPLLRAVMERGATGYEWRILPENPLVIVDSPESEAHAARVDFDLTREPGLRGTLRFDANGADLRVVLHHACSDGQGARILTQDYLAAYAALRGAVPAEDAFFKMEPERLRQRGSIPPTTGLAEAGLSASPLRPIIDAWKFCFRGPDPVQVAAPPTVSDLRNPLPYAHVEFSREQTARIEEQCKAERVALSDLATAFYFESLAEWQREHGISERRKVRVLVPFDLRNREDERMPAATRVTLTFLERTLQQCAAPGELLKSIQEEIAFYRQTRFGVEFLHAIGLCIHAPRLVRWLLRRRRCFATAVITNMGNPLRRVRLRLPTDEFGRIISGELLLTRLRINKYPIRRDTRCGLVLCDYGDELVMTLRYDHHTLIAAAAEQFMARYRQRWETWLIKGNAIA